MAGVAGQRLIDGTRRQAALRDDEFISKTGVVRQPFTPQKLTLSRIGDCMVHVSNDVSDLLRQHGVQVTAQRIAILQAIAERPHATADELGDVVRTQLGAISRQAVYDSLGMLVDKNIIRRIQPAGSPTRYENRVGDNHHHLICRNCRAMFDVDCATGEVPCLTAVDDHGFEVDEAEVIYWGRCPTCRAQAESDDAAPVAS